MAHAIGDRIPNLYWRSSSGNIAMLEAANGVPQVLIFLPEGTGATSVVAGEFARMKPQFDAISTRVICIASEGEHRAQPVKDVDALHSMAAEPALPLVVDAAGTNASMFDAQANSVLVFDVDGRLAAHYRPTEGLEHLGEQVLAAISNFSYRQEARVIRQQAPILLLPEVFPIEFCRELIQIWENEGNEDSGFMVEVAGKTVGQYDHRHKNRRDHFIVIGSELHKRISDFFARRVVREVAKAFHYPITRLEQMKIACYDSARGGYFRPHRDNTTPATAHRRFACSVILNDDFEGGYLRFPEFGSNLYAASAGGAILFSGSLLHEATDVTAGKRFVLLAFFYGEKEAQKREEYNRQVAGEQRV